MRAHRYALDGNGVYCDERYRDQTERTSRSKWAVTFDERSNPLIECSFTISDVVSDKGVKSFWNVMRRAGIIPPRCRSNNFNPRRARHVYPGIDPNGHCPAVFLGRFNRGRS